MPPEVVAVALPLEPPLQDGSVRVVDADNEAALLNVTLAVTVQLLTSVTVTVYVPEETLLKVEVVAPVLHK